MLALLDRAQQGDQSAVSAVREVLNDPQMMNALGGDLARHAEERLIKNYSGQNLLVHESLKQVNVAGSCVTANGEQTTQAAGAGG